MKKYIVYIIVASTAVALYAAKKEKQKPSTTKPDKGVLVAQVSDKFVTCPRTASQPEIFNPTEEKLYEHCSKCGMGVFFPREEGKMSCSFCENTVETVAVLP
jgi:hypothetical protein